MKLRDLNTAPPVVKNYDMSLSYLPTWVASELTEGYMDLNPDFQRGHVWTLDQQKAFMGHVIQGGVPGIIRFNIVGPVDEGRAYIVDGLQRLTAIRKWIDNEIPARLHDGREFFLRDFDDQRGLNKINVKFEFTNLDRAGMLDYYIRLNSGGTVHSQEEIDRVRTLLQHEVKS